MISGASEEELIEAIGRADILLEFIPKIKQLQQENEQLSKEIDVWNKKYNDMFDENKQLKDNWNKLKEYIDIKLYNAEYLQKLCGCGIDDETHMILDIIKKEMQELEKVESDE